MYEVGVASSAIKFIPSFMKNLSTVSEAEMGRDIQKGLSNLVSFSQEINEENGILT
jgi:hypothetical protein